MLNIKKRKKMRQHRFLGGELELNPKSKVNEVVDKNPSVTKTEIISTARVEIKFYAIKKTVLFFCMNLLFFNQIFAQTVQDTKEFIIEQVKSNPPLSNYVNYIFFKDNILKWDADKLAGKTLSTQEFENLFIYSREVYYREGMTGWLWSVAEIIDIRDMRKVSIQKSNGNNGEVFYSINIYLNDIYFNTSYYSDKNKKENKYLDVMKIVIGNNYEASVKIKKAIIHLGKLYGVTVIDGDFF